MQLMRKLVPASLAAMLGLAAGAVLLGASGPPTRTSDTTAPAKRLSPPSASHNSAIDAAIAHAQPVSGGSRSLEGEVVFRFPSDEDRASVRVAGHDFCRIYTAHRLSAATAGTGGWRVPSASDGISCTDE